MRRWPVCLTARLLLALLVGGAVVLPALSSPLADRLDEVFADDRLASASIGALAVVTGSGEVVYERDADRSLIPASNIKLVTALVALDRLHADFRYTTELRADGPLTDQGWIVGDLYLRGSGDPTLSHADLEELASQAAALGITRVTGSLVADGTCFGGPSLGSGWAWDNESYAYSAQTSGLAVDGNAVLVKVSAGPRVGAPCALALDPPSEYLTLDRRCVTGEPDGEKPVVFRRRAQNVVAATGPLPLGKAASARVTVENPALYAAVLLRQSLADSGILIEGSPIERATAEASVLVAQHTSLPLSEILGLMNRPSDNNIAEALLRTIPRAVGKPGTADAGAEVARESLAGWGIATEPLRLCDGSGLSRYNLLTARALVAVLRHAALDAGLRPAFVDSLPVAGQDGTLGKRMRGTSAEGLVRAKTGSLRGVCSLSGYVPGTQERNLAFSFLVNNYTCSASVVRGLQDRACEILAEYASE